jgi:hypothetical protein
MGDRWILKICLSSVRASKEGRSFESAETTVINRVKKCWDTAFARTGGEGGKRN